MIALLLLGLAEARTVPCDVPTVRVTSPSAGATDVPLDAAIGLVFDASSCDLDTSVVVTLQAADLASDRKLDTRVEAGPGRLVTWLPIASGLGAETEYLLTLTSPEAELVEITFRTGAATTAPLEGVPAAELVAATWFAGERREVSFEALIAPVADPFGASLVGLVDPDDPARIVAGAIAEEPDVALSGELPAHRRPREACIRAVQWDMAGRLVGEGELLCARPTRAGCSTAPGAVSAALLVLSLLTIRTRRP